MKGVWLEDLTWPEAKARFDGGAVVIVPVGAAAQAHGAHLPLKTDWLTARALGQRLIERLPVVAAPVLGVGHDPAFTRFAGSQHLGEATFKALVGELLDGLAHHGATRVALINTGVAAEKALDEVVAVRKGVAALHMRDVGHAAESLIEVREGGHADESETSVMLALDPRAVRMDKLAPAGDFAASGAAGDPRRATAFKGERVLAARVDDLVARLCALWPQLGPVPR